MLISIHEKFLEFRAENSFSGMERETFLETIQDLKESIKHSNDMICSLQDTIRAFSQNWIVDVLIPNNIWL